MIKAILFDLDNTLIDFMKMKKLACEEAIDAMIGAGLKINKSKGLQILHKLYDKYGIEYHQIFQEFLKKVINKIDYRILAHGINAYRKVRFGFLVPYPGVKRTLIALKNKKLKLGIVTDAPRSQAWLRLTAMGLDDFFDVVVTWEDVGKKKPAKLPFATALKKLNIKAEECLMVGDRPNLDIKGAKKLGIRTCFAKYGYIGKISEIKADFEISEIEDLLKVVKKVR